MIRILFVDDEINVLQAMRRTLHGMRSEWDMEFASSGPEALAMFAGVPVDVLVCDMKMPGMDGWQLLAEVKTLSPQTVRLVLSGHAEAGAIVRSVGTAHQYLAKPCDGTSLKNAILQIQNLRRLISSDHLAALIGRVGMLPSSPQIFHDMLACMRQPSFSLNDVASIVVRDVAMTANIMKLVNSAFFGSRRPIATLERAVAYLGLDTLGALVVGHGVFTGTATNTAAGFSHEQLWQHSLRTAMTARTIARHERLSSAVAEEAFLAGMLHDVGKLVLATLPSEGGPGAPLSREDTLRRIRDHHAEVGAYLLGLWGFPTPIVEAVAFHHQPSLAAGGGLSLPGILHIADQLARESSPGHEEDAFELEPGFLERLDLVGHVPQWREAMNVHEAELAPA